MQWFHPMQLLEKKAHRSPTGMMSVASLGGARIWFISDPMLVAEVLKNETVFDRRGVIYQALEGGEHGVLKEGLFTQSDRKQHARERDACNPFFYRANLVDTSTHIVERVQATASTWLDGDEVNLYQTLVADSLDILTYHLFGGKIPPELTREIAELGPAYFKKMAWQLLLSNYPRLGKLTGYDKAGQKFGEVLDQIIDLGLQKRGEFTGTLLGALLREFNPTTEFQYIKGTLGTFYLAGFDSTAVALSKALLYLVERPDIQARLREEIHRVFSEGFIDPARISALPTVRAFWEFVLHKFTSFQVIFRNVSQDCTLGSVELKKGDQILIGLHAMHTDPRHCPEDLTLEAFLPNSMASERPPHRPFGAYGRKCIGAPLATTQGVLTLAVLLQTIEFSGRPRPNLGNWLGISMTSHLLDSRAIVRRAT